MRRRGTLDYEDWVQVANCQAIDVTPDATTVEYVNPVSDAGLDPVSIIRNMPILYTPNQLQQGISLNITRSRSRARKRRPVGPPCLRCTSVNLQRVKIRIQQDRPARATMACISGIKSKPASGLVVPGQKINKEARHPLQYQPTNHEVRL